jgi:hypothetical protein
MKWSPFSSNSPYLSKGSVSGKPVADIHISSVQKGKGLISFIRSPTFATFKTLTSARKSVLALAVLAIVAVGLGLGLGLSGKAELANKTIATHSDLEANKTKDANIATTSQSWAESNKTLISVLSVAGTLVLSLCALAFFKRHSIMNHCIPQREQPKQPNPIETHRALRLAIMQKADRFLPLLNRYRGTVAEFTGPEDFTSSHCCPRAMTYFYHFKCPNVAADKFSAIIYMTKEGRHLDVKPGSKSDIMNPIPFNQAENSNADSDGWRLVLIDREYLEGVSNEDLAWIASFVQQYIEHVQMRLGKNIWTKHFSELDAEVLQQK